MSDDVQKVVFPASNLKGRECPYCGGIGYQMFNSTSMSLQPDGSIVYRSKPPTHCTTCKGKGRVNVTPLED